MARPEAEALVAAARRQALELFPDKAGTYDLILAPRFAACWTSSRGPRGQGGCPFRPALTAPPRGFPVEYADRHPAS
jgi:hypothetical protein